MSRLASVFEALGEQDRPYFSCLASTTFCGVHVDHDAVIIILSHLCARDLCVLGSACRLLRSLCGQTYPGIKLELYPHQRVSLAWMRRQEGTRRGGILADEPGCGKTITVLALLCQTAGLWVPPPERGPCVLDLADEQWASLPIAYRRPIVYRLLKAVRRAAPAEYELFNDARPVLPNLPGYTAIVQRPMDFVTLGRDETIAGFHTFRSLADAVRSVGTNARSYWTHPSCAFPVEQSTAVVASADALAAPIDAAVREATSTLAGARGDRADGMAAAPLLASRCTLVVVPRPLLQHWSEQMAWHLKQGGLCGEIIIDSDAPTAASSADTFVHAQQSAQHMLPLGARYRAARLARCAVLLTSYERLSQEQRQKNLQGECTSVLLQVRWLRLVVDEGHSLGGGGLTNRAVILSSLSAERRWLLSGTPAKGTTDAEGVLGLRSLLGFLQLNEPRLEPQRVGEVTRRFLRAQAGSEAASGLRWVVTGPSRPANGLELTRGELSEALRRGKERSRAAEVGAAEVGLSADGVRFTEEEWDGFGITDLLVSHFIKAGDTYFQPAESALLHLLSLAMIRHLKRRIRIPQPRHTTVRLRCSPPERLAYNTIVGYIRANIVLTSMEGGDAGAGHEVSILNSANLRSARVAIENIRLTCNGGGKQVARLSEDYFNEARSWLSERYKAPLSVVQRACSFMRGAMGGASQPCDRCGVQLQLLLIFPTCGHLLCPECVDAHTRGCPKCGEPLPSPSYLKCNKCDLVHCQHGAHERAPHTAHPVDGFAYLQPGFELEWAETRHEQARRAGC